MSLTPQPPRDTAHIILHDMKIRILLAAFAVSIFAAGCAKTKTPEPTPAAEYTVTLTDDGHGTAKATVGNAEAAKAKEGDLVTITATPENGYIFKQWSVVSGGAALSGTTIATATFTMPAKAVEIRAGFESEPVQNTYPITFTNDGHGTAKSTVSNA